MKWGVCLVPSAIMTASSSAETSLHRPDSSRPTDRIVSIDVIRGIAIAGILLINITYFLNRAGQDEAVHGVDAVIWQVIDVLALGKFHFVFAFLFGTGVFIFLSRLTAKGRSTWVYIRRMLILIVAGAVNSALGGIDVLASYGCLALVLLLLTLVPRSVLVTVGIAAAIIPDALHMLSTLSSVGIEIPGALLLVLEFGRTLGHMVLGFWLAERGLFAAGTRVPVGWIFGIGLVLSLPVWIWSFTAGTGTEAAHEVAFRTAMIPGLMYITGLILLLRLPLAQRGLSFLRFYGRMAFSNYLGQTVICVTILPLLVGPGRLSALAALGFWLGVVVVQCVISMLWLRWLRFGPLEWVWRCGTYLEITPLRADGDGRSL
ncbi:DUF418 domain-containing protein [Brevibacterium marinum]